MNKLSEDKLLELLSRFKYKNLELRYRTLEREVDLKEGDVVLDGGAFVGDMAQYFSEKVGLTGKVYSWEPYRVNYRRLNQFLYDYNISNVVPILSAMWDKNEKIPFYLSEHMNAGSPIKEFRKVGKKNIYVNGKTIDTFVSENNIQKVNLIWTNIEGSEYKAITGAKKTLEKFDVKLFICTHDVKQGYRNTQDVMNLLDSYGYQSKIVDNSSKWIYSEKRKL